ncbi:peptidase inhibitor family I36 protein [Streptomyces sp. NPDC060006]|uniref:peptidase inhibitor family I36 protein n=1 Tax=unclassified Streptomyces TaxID=2593676 RepID=UPI0022AC4374|nr:peptidase inhibitor family I36 protein [Streptomyces aurantiacus]WAU83297.1 peptidase inhibitor family I36 protein [Streptomyces aurantiacus]
MRKRVLSALAGAAALAGVMSIAPTASAEANPPGCPKGYFCAYSEPDQRGTLLMKTAGDWSGEIHSVGSVFNNGYVYPGGDHIDLVYGYTTSVRRICLHYNPGPGEYKANIIYATIGSVKWRGEC